MKFDDFFFSFFFGGGRRGEGGLGDRLAYNRSQTEFNSIKLLQVYFTSVAIVFNFQNDSYTCKLKVLLN